MAVSPPPVPPQEYSSSSPPSPPPKTAPKPTGSRETYSCSVDSDVISQTLWKRHFLLINYNILILPVETLAAIQALYLGLVLGGSPGARGNPLKTCKSTSKLPVNWRVFDLAASFSGAQ